MTAPSDVHGELRIRESETVELAPAIEALLLFESHKPNEARPPGASLGLLDTYAALEADERHRELPVRAAENGSGMMTSRRRSIGALSHVRLLLREKAVIAFRSYRSTAGGNVVLMVD
jgi:hypothetical protein